MGEMARGENFTVIIHSIGPSLALRVHEALKESKQYKGFIQILPHWAIHRRLFGSCGTTMRLERKSLFVLSSEDPDEDDDRGEETQIADEIVQWAKDRYPQLNSLA
jgi:hypothetical protein